MTVRPTKLLLKTKRALPSANLTPGDNDRYRLVGGPYSPPLIPKSGLLRCEIRGRLPVGKEDQLLGTKTDREVAARLHRSIGGVVQRRLLLGIPNTHPAECLWTPEEDQLLRTYSDREVARRTGRSLSATRQRRGALNLPAVEPKLKPWTPNELHLLGKKSDRAVARLTDRTVRGVGLKRLKMPIAPSGSRAGSPTP